MRQGPPDAAAIVSVGAVTGHGLGAPGLFGALLEGRTAIARITRFSTEGLCSGVGAQAPADEALGDAQGARCTRLLLAAAREALAGRPRPRPERRGVVVGTTKGAFEGAVGAWANGRASDADPLGEPARALATFAGAHGAALTVGAACASSLAALAQARALISSGQCDEVVVGGAEALHPFVYAGFHALKALSPKAATPFDAQRDGLSLGEGSGVLVLTSPAFAEAYASEPMAWLTGDGSACDGHDQTAPDPTGAGLARACARALASAGVDANAVRAYFAHGTATPQNDRMEAAAYATLFAGRAVPLCATKGSVGHTLGAAGALDAVAAVLALRAGVLPPVTGLTHKDPALPVDAVVRSPRRFEGGPVLVTAAGFGGINAAVVLAGASA
jgi:3-oxoacyl-[acyl-carrier-protein] synthase II